MFDDPVRDRIVVFNMEVSKAVAQWYVVQTKAHKESAAVENLQRQGYVVYWPKIIKAAYRNKRWTKVLESLFPRYLFIKLEEGVDNFAPIRSTIGVQKMLEFGHQPAVVSQQIINGIQEQATKEHASNHPNWKPGDDIEIIQGPFAGLRGIFEAKSGDERVILLLQLLGGGHRVTVSLNSVVSA